MKFVFIILCSLSLTGCNADTLPANENNQERNMFGLGKSQAEKFVISSPLDGVLQKSGKPLANTKIIRRLSWNGNDEGLIEEFTTDEQGRFSLPIHEEELSLGMLDQFVANMELYVGSEEIENLIWYSPKFDPEIYSEIKEPINQCICDIDAEEMTVFFGNSEIPGILTKCRWNNMPKS